MRQSNFPRHHTLANRARVICQTLSRFIDDQRGASFSISVAMMLPILIAVVCVFIQLSLLIIASQSLRSAMHTACHATRSWAGHRDALFEHETSLEDVVRQAAYRSLVPFGDAKAESHSGEDEDEAVVGKVAADLGLGPRAVTRFENKSASFQDRVRVRIEESEDGKGLLVHVELDSPLWAPVVYPLFQNATSADGKPARTLVAETVVPMNEHDIDRSDIRIPYSPLEAESWP